MTALYCTRFACSFSSWQCSNRYKAPCQSCLRSAQSGFGSKWSSRIPIECHIIPSFFAHFPFIFMVTWQPELTNLPHCEQEIHHTGKKWLCRPAFMALFPHTKATNEAQLLDYWQTELLFLFTEICFVELYIFGLKWCMHGVEWRFSKWVHLWPNA